MEHAQRKLGVSERRACRALSQPRSTQRYHGSPRADEARLVDRMTALALQYGRYGYRKIARLLRQEGFAASPKRIERQWRREGLKVPKRQPRRRRLWLHDGSCIRRRAEGPNHVWSYDFVQDRTTDGRVYRMLVVVDEFTRECLTIRVARNLSSWEVIEALADLFLSRGLPTYIRSACYVQVCQGSRPVRSSNRGEDAGKDSWSRPSCFIRTCTRGAEGARRKYVELSSSRRARDNGGHLLLSGKSRSLGCLGCDLLLLLPNVVDVKGFSVLDDSESVVQEFRHTGTESVHLAQRSHRSLLESFVVGLDARIVLNRRQSRHVDDRSQLRPSTLGDGRSSG